MSVTVGDAVLYVRGNTEKLPGDLKQSEGQVKSWGQNIKEQMKGAMSVAAGNLMSQGIQQISGAMQNLARDVMNTSATYIVEVEEMARATGMASEDTSRLIQVADDFRVSTGDLNMAIKTYSRTMKDAGDNSAISIDTIASLSDQYMRLAPGVERNNFLLEKFGKSGMNMAMMMEQGGDSIRQMSGEVDSSLVVTQEAIQAQREYEMAMDDFEDSLTGVKMELAKALLPVLKDAVVLLKDSVIPAMKELVGWFVGLPEPVRYTVVALGGLVVLLAQAGPALMGIAGIVSMLGGASGLAAIGTAFSSLAGIIPAAIGVILSPIALLVAAIGVLIYTIINLGPSALNTVNMIIQILGMLPLYLKIKVDEMLATLAQSAGKWLQAGQTFVKNLADGVRNGWNWLVTSVKNIVTQAISALSNVRNSFVNVGLAIVYGIGDGIKKGWDWLKSTVTNMATSMLNAAKAALHIKSPSQDFADQVGKQAALGISQGFNDNLNLVTGKMRTGLADLAPSVMSGGGGNVRVGHIEYHGSFSADEMERLNRSTRRMANNTLREAIR